MFIGTRIEQILSWNLFGTINKKKNLHTYKKNLHTRTKIYTHAQKFTHTYKKNILCQISLRK